MKHVHIFFAFLLIPLLLGVARNAQAQRWDWNSFGTAQQFRSFDMFLSEHSKTAKKLWEKPDRVNDPGFLNGNKELKQWLEDHPAAAREFHEEPWDSWSANGIYRFTGGTLTPARAAAANSRASTGFWIPTPMFDTIW